MSAPLEIEVHREKRDYRNGMTIDLLNRPDVVRVVFLPGVIFALLLMWATLRRVNEGDVFPFQVLAIMAGVFAALILGHVAWCYVVARRAWHAPQAYQPVTYLFTDSSMTICLEGHSCVVPWSACRTALETERLLIVRTWKKEVHIFPKREFSVETLRRLKDLLRTALKGRVHFMGEWTEWIFP